MLFAVDGARKRPPVARLAQRDPRIPGFYRVTGGRALTIADAAAAYTA
ncbi:MAG: hypothetical protein U1F10_04235 [Burkholderiales bacterium]